MTIKKIGSLEIESEAQHVNETFITIQKIGVVIMVLIILLAFLGAFGKGIFGLITKTEDNMTISYEKFIRNQATTVYQITINPKSNNEIIKFWLEPSFYNKLSIKSIMPTPELESIQDDKIVYSFKTMNSNSIRITLVAEPISIGSISSGIGLFSGEKIQFNQLIYP